MPPFREHAGRALALLGGEPRVAALTLSTAALHLAVAGRYGIYGDELYFITCGRHPAFGYVDQPPLVPLIDAATQLFGTSAWLLRLPAALAATVLVPLTAAFARRLGGTALSAFLAAAGVALAPILSVLTSITATWTFEPLSWTLCTYFVACGAIEGRTRDFVWAGLVAGLSLEAKYCIAFWLIALALGFGLTDARRFFLSRFLWLGAALGAALAVPSVAWQFANDWPFLDVIEQHRSAGSNLTGTPWQFGLVQILVMNPVLAPLWLAGVIAPFVSTRLKPARFLAIAYVVAALIDYGAGGRYYYLVAAYPSLMAVGAVAFARLRSSIVTGWLGAAALSFAVVLPVILPILPLPALASYLRVMPFDAYKLGAEVGLVFSWELGWPELESRVAETYRALPEDERRRTAIFTANFGEASAIDFYGQADDLPRPISGHNQYFLWGAGGDIGTLIIVNADRADWAASCAALERADTFGVPFGHPMESGRPILVCHGYRKNLQAVWSGFRDYE
jgi:4-amino-4-deoxy-L-arabinose transferase-like glycosyltransferase